MSLILKNWDNSFNFISFDSGRNKVVKKWFSKFNSINGFAKKIMLFHWFLIYADKGVLFLNYKGKTIKFDDCNIKYNINEGIEEFCIANGNEVIFESTRKMKMSELDPTYDEVDEINDNFYYYLYSISEDIEWQKDLTNAWSK